MATLLSQLTVIVFTWVGCTTGLPVPLYVNCARLCHDAKSLLLLFLATKKPSHRARIPNILRAALGPNQWRPTSAALDVETAVFERVWTNLDNPQLQAIERTYAHRSRRGLLVSTFTFSAFGAPYNVSWRSSPGPRSQDIDFSHNPGNSVTCGRTIVPEATGAPLTTVCFSSRLETGSITVTTGANISRLLFISTSLDSPDPASDAVAGLSAAALIPSEELLGEHKDAWTRLWSHGIEVSGSLQLSQIINSSLYYLLSSSRNDFPWSLSPGSLSSNSYNGHVFWDSETWMLPTLSVLHREIASSILLYRNLRLAGAKQKAASNGYSGLQFPWESAQLGVEVTPTDADTGIYEQHISSDIVLAVKQLWRLSGDLNWLKSYLDLVCGVADFWASRVQRRNDGSFGIYGVTGPDEYAVNVNNSAYTNAAARLSLEFAVEICGLLNVSCQNAGAWGEIASQMYIPFDSSRGIHPEYDGYTGGKIKQADVVLLGYPLGLDITDTVRLNDVKYYAARTDVNGPCMTDGIHTIALLSCGLPEAAAEYFPKSFANAKPPFWVWQETPTGGAVNFITGAGGFLQALIFGYGGLRIENGSLLFSPRLAPETSSMKVRGVRYRLAVFDVFWDQDHVIILNLPESAMTIFISDGLRSHEVPAGQRFQFPVSPFSVFAG
eukprot:TRINITY_DN813_c0_g1_i5.p1 TRINITY_DN813_c0_g1~~TRINITY_DN813_c0_g1_i5.p1  ORF type:complete len:666 (+),score=37.76 TRINITY_DN813_c0_g1_i5:1105-3102(+)